MQCDGDVYFWVYVYGHGPPKSDEEQADRWMTDSMISFCFPCCRGDLESADLSPSLSPFFMSQLSQSFSASAQLIRMWVSPWGRIQIHCSLHPSIIHLYSKAKNRDHSAHFVFQLIFFRSIIRRIIIYNWVGIARCQFASYVTYDRWKWKRRGK